jgi:hypothetical protein
MYTIRIIQCDWERAAIRAVRSIELHYLLSFCNFFAKASATIVGLLHRLLLQVPLAKNDTPTWMEEQSMDSPVTLGQDSKGGNPA